MHKITDEKTPRGRQLIRALALAHLLEQDLPMVRWTVGDNDPDLNGQIYRTGDETAVAHMEAWAEFLRAEVTEDARSNGTTEWTHLELSATYRDAPVRIWAQIDHAVCEDLIATETTEEPTR
jgi:hypothetical protein